MSWDPMWDDIFKSRSWGQYPAEDFIRFVARNFYAKSPRSDVRILEVGCGPGANLWYLAREGFATFGIDGSATAVKQAIARLDAECNGWRERGDAKLMIGEVASLPWPDQYFDAVVDNECLSCNAYDESRSIYAEMARVTKSGGKLYSRTFASRSWGDDTGRAAGHHAWYCGEGPLVGKGLVRFTALEEIPDLVQGYAVLSTELLSWTVNNRGQSHREWIIIGEKPQAG